MPKLLSLLLCFAMVFSLLALPAQAAKADASSVDGTYTGTGTGRNGDITLSVTIADGKITQIENISNKETPKYWAEAVKLFDSILAANGTDGVDAVSGATLSSDGILAAVDDALAKASVPLPESFCMMKPSPPKMPEPSFFWKCMDSSTPASEARNALFCTIME